VRSLSSKYRFLPHAIPDKGTRPMKRLLPALACLVLAACSSGLDRKFDGSNEKKFEASLEAIKKSAKPEDIAKLDEAMLVLAVTDVSIGYEGGILGALKKLQAAKSPGQLADQLMPVVDGMTGRQVIAAGQKRRKDEASKQLAVTAQEIAKLSATRDENARSKTALEGIEVLEATLRFNSQGPEKISVMDFKVRNGTAGGLTYLYMRGTVTEPVSGKALYSDDINYKLSESPLLPGETKALRLPHSSRGKWNAPEIWGKENLVFKIDVVNAEDLAGKRLAASFTHKDATRLLLLESNRQALQKMLED